MISLFCNEVEQISFTPEKCTIEKNTISIKFSYVESNTENTLISTEIVNKLIIDRETALKLKKLIEDQFGLKPSNLGELQVKTFKRSIKSRIRFLLAKVNTSNND